MSQYSEISAEGCNVQDEHVTEQMFRKAMSFLGAPVTVVTTSGPTGRHGLTVSAVCSVSDAPPTVLVCLNRGNRSHGAFLENRFLGVNILAEGLEPTALAFSRSSMTPEDRFDFGAWKPGKTGVPLLDDALVTMECRIDVIQAIGSHDVLFCRVVTIPQISESNSGLAWFNRKFCVLGA